MSDFSEIIKAIDLATYRDAYVKARDLVLTLEPSDERERTAAQVRRLLLSSPDYRDKDWYLPLDERAVHLSRLIQSPDMTQDDAERAAAHIVQIMVVRRQPSGPFEFLDTLDKRFGETPRLAATRARALLAFDSRQEAKELLSHALTRSSDHHLLDAMADLLFEVGDLPGAAHYATVLKGTPLELDGLDTLVSIRGAMGDEAAELQAVTQGIDLAPDADNLWSRLLHRAILHISSDRIDQGHADFEAAIAAAPPLARDAVELYVAHRLNALASAGPQAKHRRLEAFPSVVQKWNYCGPAVIELCLRYVGIEMTQDIIAEAVKKGEGTPMLAIVEFLAGQGIEARRVEATPERVRAAIDLGIPVIVEDDYSNSNHVAVVIGYDDRLNMLIVADPVTHAPRRQGIEYRTAVAGDLRYAGVAVLGRKSDVTDTLRTALDDAGLFDRPHLRLLDEVAREQDFESEGLNRVSHAEQAGLARQALALEPNFAPAALLLAQAQTSSPTHAFVEVPQVLARSRSAFPQLSEFATLAGNWNDMHERRALGIAEHVHAISLDNDNANARTELAWRLLDSGRRALAYRHANAAFVRAPGRMESTALIARVVVDELLDRAREEAPEGDLAHILGDRANVPRSERLTLTSDVLTELAHRLIEALDELDTSATGTPLIKGDLQLVTGQVDLAIATYESLMTTLPMWPVPGVRLAHALASRNDGRAADQALTCLKSQRLDDELYLNLLDLIGRKGTAAQVVKAAEYILSGPTPAERVIGPTFDALARIHRSQAKAAEGLVSLTHGRLADVNAVWQVASVLRRHGFTHLAIELLEARLAVAPLDGDIHLNLARYLKDHPDFTERALDHARTALQLYPWFTSAAQLLGWLTLDKDATAAVEFVEGQDDTDLELLEIRRRGLIALGKTTQAEQVAQRQAQIEGSLLNARFHLAFRLWHSGSPARARDIDSAGSINWNNADLIAEWMVFQHVTGRLAQFMDALAMNRHAVTMTAVAQGLIDLGVRSRPDLINDACEALLAKATDPQVIALLHTRSHLTAGRLDHMQSAAGDHISAHLECTLAPVPAPRRLEFARHLVERFPQTLEGLTAHFHALIDNNHVAEARKVVSELEASHPLEHQTLSAAAMVELLVGDVERGARLAQTAYAIAPLNNTALTVASLAYALTEDWDNARKLGSEAATRDVDHPQVAATKLHHLVVAGSTKHRSKFDESLEARRHLALATPIDRLIRACGDRLG